MLFLYVVYICQTYIMDLAISLWEKNMIFACHTIAHGTNLRRSPQGRQEFQIKSIQKFLLALSVSLTSSFQLVPSIEISECGSRSSGRPGQSFASFEVFGKQSLVLRSCPIPFQISVQVFHSY